MADASGLPASVSPILTASEQIAEDLFGGPLTIEETDVIAGNVTTLLVKQKPERVQYLLINNSAQTVTIAYKVPVVNGAGLTLGANGGFALSKVNEDGQTVGWELNGISPAGGASLRLIEWLRITKV